jgi:DNA-binding transcriptional regulator YhcF (GntR family)
MVRWFIDKSSKIPFYVQLKNLIQYYISTGAFLENQQLPTVSELANQVGITFETARKSYKELERDGLIESTRGRGTFVRGHVRQRKSSASRKNTAAHLAQSLKLVIQQLLEEGQDASRLTSLFHRTLREAIAEQPRQIIVFTECNELQVRTISETLVESLKVEIRPVLLDQLQDEIRQLLQLEIEPAAVVTTGFHLKEVRQLLSHTRIPVDFVITRMSPQTRRTVEAFDKNARFGFICRDEHSVPLYRDLLKSELELRSDLASSTLADPRAVTSLLASLDVLLVSPPVYEQIKKIAPPKLKIFNVFDWIDPLSLQGIRDRLGTVNVRGRSGNDRVRSSAAFSRPESDLTTARVRS